MESKQPLHQESAIQDVCKVATWLCGDGSLGVTGQIINGRFIGSSATCQWMAVTLFWGSGLFVGYAFFSKLHFIILLYF